MSARCLQAGVAAALAVAALCLAGCGQKGPLVLPERKAPYLPDRAAAPETRSDDRARNDGQDGGDPREARDDPRE